MHPDAKDSILNPAAPLTMVDEVQGGEAGAFFPSSLHTSDGGYVPVDLHLKPQSCGGSACHADVVRFRLQIPEDAGDSITVETRLNYRKFAWDLTQFSYAGVPDPERWNDYGIGLLRQGDLRAARHAFEQVTLLQPEYVDGWVNLGRVALAEGDLDEAEQVLGRALEIDPNLARSHFFAGLRQKELGEYDLALEHFDKVIAQYPRDRVVLNQRARVRFLRREYPLAIEEARKVHEVDPEDLMAHYASMLAHRGAGDLESSKHHQALYERFKADEASQTLTGEYLKEHPHDNNERQPIHEHRDGVRLTSTTPEAPQGAPAVAAEQP